MKKQLIPYTWKHADLSYDHPKIKTQFKLLSRAKEYVYFENKMDFAYAAIYKDHIIFAFKGTSNIEGWISNLDPYPLKSDEYSKKYLKNGKWGSGCIHDGFYTSWKFFKSCINKVIETYHINPKETKVICCGHSRGGALAELCARHLAKNLNIQNSCFTFGAPAVGTKRYRDQFRMLPVNGTRVVNGRDIVPTLPPKIIGFRHGCPNKIWFRSSWWRRFIPRISIKDHLSYGKVIIKRFKKR